MKKHSILLAILVIFVAVLSAQAKGKPPPPSPSEPSIVPLGFAVIDLEDDSLEDWQDVECLTDDLYQAGNKKKGKPIISEVCTFYNPLTQMMYQRAQAVLPHTINDKLVSYHLKLDGSAQWQEEDVGIVDNIFPDVQKIGEGMLGVCPTVDAYEAAWHVVPGVYTAIAHISINVDNVANDLCSGDSSRMTRDIVWQVGE